MDNTPYLASVSGRLLALVIAIAFVGAGLVAVAAPGGAIWIKMMAPLLCITVSIYVIGLAVNDYGKHAVMLAIALPFFGGIYWYLLALFDGTQGAWGWLLVAAALVPLFASFRPLVKRSASAGSHPAAESVA